MDRREFLIGAAFLTAAGREGAAAEEVKILKQGGEIGIAAGGRPVLRYYQKPVTGPPGTPPLFARSGYIHPLVAPNGAVVTDDFAADHPHQRGVFFAWTKTAIGDQDPDFWNLGAGKARIVSMEAAETRRGFRARHSWEMRSGDAWTPVLDETWEVTCHPPQFDDPLAPNAAFVIDLTSRQKPRVEILLPEYRYGGMAVRGARDWMTDRKRLTVVTSEGKDLATADATRARWVDMSGKVGDREAGIALLEHPANLGAPNTLRVPPDHPYVVFSPPKAGPIKLEAGKEYVFRYRLIAHNGPSDRARLEREWKALSDRTGK